jgi:predicted CxxxxCH...CXXCH cytochrome family protein
MTSRRLVGCVVVLTGAFAACEKTRAEDEVVPWAGRVETLLEAQCVRCHAGLAPAAGWRADSYLGAIGCTSAGRPATLGGDASPLLTALARPDHAALVSPEERAALAGWVAGGSSRGGDGLHGRSFADPRSPSSHGRFLRAKSYRPMLDANDADACGTCHDGAPRKAGISVAAAGAPACTTCHTEPGGALGCGTCHGDGTRAFPPRDPCFFPEEPGDRAHGVHVGPNAARATGLPCATCHPVPAPGQVGEALHADGFVEVWFDHAVAGPRAFFDQATQTCTGTCHERGGARPAPAWRDPPMTCNDCHSSPPANHYRGACTSCHREADDLGTALTNPMLHMNGKVDLGDGSGRCGACHGQGDDPWPSTGAHKAHAQPGSSRPVACETCHAVPSGGLRHPEGLGAAKVTLGGLARAGGRRPSYDPASKTCAGTYCHEGSGARTPAPRWTATDEATCTSCHGAPPPPPHVQSTTCGGGTCHEGSTDGASLTAHGREFHVDGLITRGLLP